MKPTDPSGAARLGAVAPADLPPARAALHHAAQLLASFGAAHVDARPDDSHRNLGWDAGAHAFRGHPGTRHGLRAQLSPRDLRLALLDADGSVLRECGLPGKTLAAARSWLADVTAELSGEAPLALTPPEYTLPAHPVAQGAALAAEPAEAFAELGRWYDLASAGLERVRARETGASEVRCWPHHFDIATLVTVAPDPDPEKAKTIGIGMTPGDEAEPAPYWYVTPWPYPKDPPHPPLDGGGRWHTEGWFGALLPADALVGDGSGQRQRLDAFLASALEAAHALHGS